MGWYGDKPYHLVQDFATIHPISGSSHESFRWVTTLVINWISKVSPLATRLTTHSLTGMKHQVLVSTLNAARWSVGQVTGLQPPYPYPSWTAHTRHLGSCEIRCHWSGNMDATVIWWNIFTFVICWSATFSHEKTDMILDLMTQERSIFRLRWRTKTRLWPVEQGLVNVPIEHHPTFGNIISNKYLVWWCETNPQKGTFTDPCINIFFDTQFFQPQKNVRRHVTQRRGGGGLARPGGAVDQRQIFLLGWDESRRLVTNPTNRLGGLCYNPRVF